MMYDDVFFRSYHILLEQMFGQLLHVFFLNIFITIADNMFSEILINDLSKKHFDSQYKQKDLLLK